MSGSAEALRAAFDLGFAAPPAAPGEGMTDLLCIRVGGDACAVRLGEVAGLFVDRTVVTLPGPAAALLGIVGLRGAIVPVYDLAAVLGFPGQGEPPRWLLLAACEPVALAFARFESCLRVGRSALSRGPAGQSVRLADGARAVIGIESVIDAIRGSAPPSAPSREH